MNVSYDWTTKQQYSFGSLKNKIARTTLVHDKYDPNQDVTFDVYASMKGIGTVLTHNNLSEVNLQYKQTTAILSMNV